MRGYHVHSRRLKAGLQPMGGPWDLPLESPLQRAGVGPPRPFPPPEGGTPAHGRSMGSSVGVPASAGGCGAATSFPAANRPLPPPIRHSFIRSFVIGLPPHASCAFPVPVAPQRGPGGAGASGLDSKREGPGSGTAGPLECQRIQGLRVNRGCGGGRAGHRPAVPPSPRSWQAPEPP